MNIKPLASNMTLLIKEDGTEILFSYQTPVAAHLPDGGFIRTSEWYSQTTTRHINKWLRACGLTNPKVQSREFGQDFINKLV